MVQRTRPDAVQSMISGGSIIILCLPCTAVCVRARARAQHSNIGEFRRVLDRSISRLGELVCERARARSHAMRADMSMQLCVRAQPLAQISDAIAGESTRRRDEGLGQNQMR